MRITCKTNAFDIAADLEIEEPRKLRALLRRIQKKSLRKAYQFLIGEVSRISGIPKREIKDFRVFLSKTRIYIGTRDLSASNFSPKQQKRGVRIKGFGLVRSAFILKRSATGNEPVFIAENKAGNLPTGLIGKDARFRQSTRKILKIYSTALDANAGYLVETFPQQAQKIIDSILAEESERFARQ